MIVLPAFLLYLLFVLSWFLHLPARYPILAGVRFDLVLVLLIAALSLLSRRSPDSPSLDLRTSRILLILILYIVLTIPFVEWPGSVVKNGLERFLKGVVFYFFTVQLLNTENRLRLFISVFISTQLFRALEPLYLHFTEGYWGDTASMANWETLDRLSGSPHDIINPNGLAFVILTVIPFLYFLSRLSAAHRVTAAALIPVLVYELLLTGSRSGVLGLLTIAITACLKSKHKVIFAAVLSVAALFAFSQLSSDQWDRMISLIDPSAKNAATAETRISEVLADLQVALRRPLFGHGLGTSLEANYNLRAEAVLSHNLYAEVFQEIGLVGLAIFLAFVLSLFRNFSMARITLETYTLEDSYMHHLIIGMQVWLYMNIIFSLASYGLSGYQWYLFAGLSVVSGRLAHDLRRSNGLPPISVSPAVGRRPS